MPHTDQNIDDSALEALLAWRHSLTALSLRGCPVTDMGVRVLAGFQALETLDLSKKSMVRPSTFTNHSTQRERAQHDQSALIYTHPSHTDHRSRPS